MHCLNKIIKIPLVIFIADAFDQAAVCIRQSPELVVDAVENLTAHFLLQTLALVFDTQHMVNLLQINMATCL